MSPKKVLEESQQNLWGLGAIAIWESTYTEGCPGTSLYVVPQLSVPERQPASVYLSCPNWPQKRRELSIFITINKESRVGDRGWRRIRH